MYKRERFSGRESRAYKSFGFTPFVLRQVVNKIALSLSMKHASLCLILTEPLVPKPMIYPAATTWVEVRWDKIEEATSGWESRLRSTYDKLIYTYRGEGGGEESAVASRRRQRYQEWIAEGVPFVDIDVQEPFLDDVLGTWHGSRTRLILSRHITRYRGELDLLRTEIRRMQCYRPYLCKVAVLCTKAEEAAALLSLYQEFQDLLLFAMGNVGGFTRLAAPYLGAPYTYAAYGREGVAPGLLPSPVMQAIFDAWDEE